MATKSNIEYQQDLATELYRKRSSTGDLILDCDGGRIKSHRSVINCSCDTLEFPFHQDEDSHLDVLTLPDVNVEVMEIAVKFLYLGVIDKENQATETLRQILCVAHILKINKLLYYVSDMLIPKINWSNWRDLWDLAIFLDQSYLKSGVVDFILTRLARFESQDHYRDLSFEQIFDVIRDMSDKFPGETQVRIASKWVGNDPERFQDLPRLLILVDLEELTNSSLVKLSKDERLLTSPVVLSTLLNVAARRLLMHDKNESKNF